MGTFLYNSSSSDKGTFDLAKIDATTEEDIAMQIAEDDADAAAEAELYAAIRDKIITAANARVKPVKRYKLKPE